MMKHFFLGLLHNTAVFIQCMNTGIYLALNGVDVFFNNASNFSSYIKLLLLLPCSYSCFQIQIP